MIYKLQTRNKILFIFFITTLILISIFSRDRDLLNQCLVSNDINIEAKKEALEFDKEVEAVALAIKLIESGESSDCSAIGASGEVSCYQLMPSTYSQYSIDVFGYEKPYSHETAEEITKSKIEYWLENGYSYEEIFLIWNQGNPGECKSGYNSVGTYYDSCRYVELAMKNLEQVIPSL